MATPLDPKQIVSFEELLMFQALQAGNPFQITSGRKISTSSGVKAGHYSPKKRYDFV
jgi:hypothetical protein